jgi:N-acetylglucosaminyldiphosphoundecaprenol N-acetyl-beta-D-mannosaminyltransferase
MDRKYSRIIGMHVDLTSLGHTLSEVERLAKKSEGAYICVSNVHMCMEVFDSAEFAQVVNGADLVVPDGKPIFWAQKLLGHTAAKHVRGQDITETLCASSGNKSLNIGLIR